MSGARGPRVAVGAALILGLAYWAWVVKIKPQREQAAEDAKLLFKGLDPDNTNEILLRKKGSADVLLRKVGGQWRLITPIAAPADQAAVGGLVTELAAAKREEIIVDKGADLRDFGLDQPSGEVTFQPATPGAKAEVLFFGMDSPDGRQAYAVVDGKPAVFLTDLFVKNSVLKDAGDLRDKTVWAFSPSDVEAVRSDISGFTVARDKDGRWQVDAPPRHEPGKGTVVDDWLDDLSRLRADSVPSETGKGNFGLRRGKALWLKLENGTFLVLTEGGKAKPGPGVYVQVAGHGPVYQLPSYLAATIEKKALDLMDLNVFSFGTGDVVRFEVRRPKGTLTAVKTSGVWNWVPTLAAKPGAKPFDFYAFLSALANTQLLRRLDAKAAPLTPAASVTFYGDNSVVLEKAVFGARRDGGQVASSLMKSQTVLAAANLLDSLPPDAPSAPAAPVAVSGAAKP